MMSQIEPHHAGTNVTTAAVSIGERAAVFAFAAWLSKRKQAAVFGAQYDSGEAAVLADRFCLSQGWPDVPEGWQDKLRDYPKE
jgi:hypothetical protein